MQYYQNQNERFEDEERGHSDDEESEEDQPAQPLPKKCPFGNTLEESVTASVVRDLYQIAIRTRYVMIPFAGSDSEGHLKNWDLWGPLLLCI